MKNAIATILVGMVLPVLIISAIDAAKKGWQIEFNIPHLHKANDIWFKDKTGLIFGYYSSLDDLLIIDLYRRLSKREAIILRKNQNGGDKWLKVFSGDGEILQVSYNSSEMQLFALGRSYAENGKEQSSILFSKDLGRSWCKIQTPPELLTGICFRTKKTSIVWTESSIFRSLNNGVSWEKIFSGAVFTKSRPKPIVSVNGDVWIPANKEIFKIDKQNKTTKMRVPRNFKLDLLQFSYDDVLWIAGRKKVNQDITLSVYKLISKHFVPVAELGNLLPNYLHIGEKQIDIYGTDFDNMPPKKILVYSKNNGKTWKYETPLITNATGPTYFENELVIWDVATRNRIQKRYERK